ncbi:PepSY-associated TM helix domain-containing protein [Thauera linaloolentis]|uniref:PepSY-associated TM helix domain-containing protein n=1 Tax=Thauera linaloolentis (strain DSM 12138 / JCM 21573 / CCUG 41526 / CIP 105981 / IAM 15112 / NBRC 102519 / 47Lol) TaxID=1123367 RepID=N6Z2B4_THAL4|nr:PepSY-associated TM helix domain-containing protein [Thauera linaloolentis]ENO88752.1 PepSY-associated TM helix domain-containing protein [Thauera linaloolentis 47Lol = DSM 12138]MCM8564939.1 PepSY domain-containing protein [Thauera linaloolentis]
MSSRSLISNTFTRAMLNAHQWLGILFCTLVWLVCVSGTLGVLLDEFAQWEAPSAPRVEQADGTLFAHVATAAFAEARAQGADHDLFVLGPTPELPWLRIFALGEHEGAAEPPHLEWLADTGGTLHPMPHTPWTTFVRDHHERLHLPSPYGAWAVGVVGTLLLASLFSGLLAHRRIFRDAFRLRRGGSQRVADADLHNRIGVWALPFHLIVSLTGSLLGLSGLIVMLLALAAYQGDQDKAIAALLGPQPGSDLSAAPLPEIAPMLREIERLTPGATVMNLIYQHVGTAGQTVSISTAEPHHLARNENWTFDGEGRFLAKAGFTDGSIGMRIYGMIQPLHFGTYGGIALKLVYVALGIGMCIVVATGPAMWLARRRGQGRPLPRTEKLWAALVWGQTAAYAAAALAAIVAAETGPALPLGVYWAVTLGSALASLQLRDERQAGHLLQSLGGILLIALALCHLLYWPSQAMAGRAIDGALLGAGLVLLLHGLRRLRPGQMNNDSRL